MDEVEAYVGDQFVSNAIILNERRKERAGTESVSYAALDEVGIDGVAGEREAVPL